MLRLVAQRLYQRGLGAKRQHLDFFVFIRRPQACGTHAFQQHEMAGIGRYTGVWREGAGKAGRPPGASV